MARRSKSRNRPQGRRVTNPSLSNANLRLHPLPPKLVSRPFVGYDVFRGKLTQVDDRRRFHPSKLARPAVSLGRRADTKLTVVSPVRSVRRLSHVVGFAGPRRVLTCVRRRIRKEVLMALGIGGGKVRKPRRTEFSDVRC